MEYVSRGSFESGCVFCLGGEDDDERRLVLLRGQSGFVILNRFPYNSGHLMIAPFRHTAALVDLTDAECAEVMALLQRAVRVLDAAMTPEGYNVGINVSAAAGAGIADHLHVHVVPRWQGDTNFMPVVGETKVMPELLADTWRRLRPLFVGKTKRAEGAEGNRGA